MYTFPLECKNMVFNINIKRQLIDYWTTVSATSAAATTYIVSDIITIYEMAAG